MERTRHDGWTGQRMAVFCQSLMQKGSVAAAARAAGMSAEGAYRCRRRRPEFAQAWDDSLRLHALARQSAAPCQPTAARPKVA